MINILETLNTYNDTWTMTFYFVAAVAIMLGLLWTILQIHKNDELKNHKLKENVIYNKSEDMIENIDIMPKRKKQKEELDNHYDIYQNENRKQKSGGDNIYLETIDDKPFITKKEESNENNNIDEVMDNEQYNDVSSITSLEDNITNNVDSDTYNDNILLLNNNKEKNTFNETKNNKDNKNKNSTSKNIKNSKKNTNNSSKSKKKKGNKKKKY